MARKHAAVAMAIPNPHARGVATTTPPETLVRTNIGIVGAMNAGKSMLMNVLTQQATSIVDSTPGTTADTKVALMELHSFGPVKLFDTPGVDEPGELGSKKRTKALAALRESDIALVVVNPFELRSCEVATELLSSLRVAGDGGSSHGGAAASKPRPMPLVVFNINASLLARSDTTLNVLIEHAERQLAKAYGAGGSGGGSEDASPLPSIVVDLMSSDANKRLASFIALHSRPRTTSVSLLPPNVALDRSSVVLLNIPLDDESPSGRLLRPQSMLIESLLRSYVSSLTFRMDLKAARGKAGPEAQAREQQRFTTLVETLARQDLLRLVVTDSQAIDVVSRWLPDKLSASNSNSTSNSTSNNVALTTFSVAMINYMTEGRLPMFVRGLERFKTLKAGDRVLICEACNHDRIQDDIGTVQIPAKLAERFGAGALQVEHAFGREYSTKPLRDYQLVIHCGGCMLDQQKMSARIDDIAASGVPITNYGILLSYLASSRAFERVLEPWAVSHSSTLG